jgi:hypothetical protein
VEDYLSQVLNVHNVNDDRQIEAEPLVPDPSSFEDEVASSKFKQYKSPRSDKFPTEMV